MPWSRRWPGVVRSSPKTSSIATPLSATSRRPRMNCWPPMEPKSRYNIRLAERKGVVVRDGADADLPAFYAMYTETGGRDAFLVRPFDYYRAIWERFLTGGLGHVLLAESMARRWQACSCSALRADRVVFYGASTAQGRDLMPNHALQWAAMAGPKRPAARAQLVGTPNGWTRATRCGVSTGSSRGSAASSPMDSARGTTRRTAPHTGVHRRHAEGAGRDAAADQQKTRRHFRSSPMGGVDLDLSPIGPAPSGS